MRRPARAALTGMSVLLVAALAVLPALAGPASAGPKRPKPSPSPTVTAAPTPTTSPAPAPTVAPSPTTPSYWTPARGTSWQIQYTGPLDTSVPAAVFNVDGFDTSATTVAALRASGRHAVCYISAGSYEDWRPDATRFPASVLGRSNGWAGERWLDIRQLQVLGPILTDRIRMCRDKGFSAVDPDNVDGYTNSTGFPLTAEHQLTFNRWLAATAHAHGLSIGLKNDLDQIPALVEHFDFAVNEQCFEYDECAALRPFTDAGKAVFHIEYSTSPAAYCPTTTAMGFSSLLKRLDLSATRQVC